MDISGKYAAKALRFISTPTSPSGDQVIAECVPTTVLLARIPDTIRIGDYLLNGPVHRAEESVFAQLTGETASRKPSIYIRDRCGAVVVS